MPKVTFRPNPTPPPFVPPEPLFPNDSIEFQPYPFSQDSNVYGVLHNIKDNIPMISASIYIDYRGIGVKFTQLELQGPTTLNGFRFLIDYPQDSNLIESVFIDCEDENEETYYFQLNVYEP